MERQVAGEDIDDEHMGGMKGQCCEQESGLEKSSGERRDKDVIRGTSGSGGTGARGKQDRERSSESIADWDSSEVDASSAGARGKGRSSTGAADVEEAGGRIRTDEGMGIEESAGGVKSQDIGIESPSHASKQRLETETGAVNGKGEDRDNVAQEESVQKGMQL